MNLGRVKAWIPKILPPRLGTACNGLSQRLEAIASRVGSGALAPPKTNTGRFAYTTKLGGVKARIPKSLPPRFGTVAPIALGGERDEFVFRDDVDPQLSSFVCLAAPRSRIRKYEVAQALDDVVDKLIAGGA